MNGMITLKLCFERLYGGSISLRERLFRIILSMGIVAMFFAILSNIALQQSLMILVPLLIGLGVLFLCLWISYRYNKMELAATVLCVLIDWIMFPLIYFASGGIESGATVWFVMGIIFIFLLFRGKKMAVILSITLGVFIGTYVAGYLDPSLITPMASEKDITLDSAMAVFLVSVAIGLLIQFQNRVYEGEQAITEKQKKELEVLNASQSTFFANMSHEIRTPINTIIGFNEMTLRENSSDEIAENSINIQNASKMLLSLINDILDLSKIESGKMEIVPVQYETGALFSELINIVWIRAHEKNLEFKLDIDKNLPSMLYGDEVRISQVLINILTNAVKYTQEGSVTLSAKCEKKGINTVDFIISVSDTGQGIRKENIAELFSSFKRLDQKKNRNIEGTGLGLSISKQLIDLMGGTIAVDSIYTKGSTFTVTVTQQIVDETPIGMLDVLLKKKLYNREKYQQSFEAPDAKILVVDDNEMNLLVAKKLLRSTKVQIDTAQSGAQCLEKTQNQQYHVIFMDHKMPGMDGVETLHSVRHQENGRCREIPVIALTANVMSGAVQIYRDYGFDGYLAKPINGALLEATLLKYLPQALIEYRQDAQEKENAEVQYIKRKKKKEIYITTDCVCDIPKKYIQEYDIGIMPYYLITDEGKFRDGDELESGAILEYMQLKGKHVYSQAAAEDEYEKFYADALEKGEQVIHITMAQNVRGRGHAAAKAAMRGFNHVTVFDSEHLSSGMGLMVLTAAKMAKEHHSQEEIISTLQILKQRIRTSFIVPSMGNLHQNGLAGHRIAKVCSLLELHPIIHLKHGNMKCCGVEIGEIEKSYQKYIRHTLSRRKTIDKRVVFITYAGCSIRQLEDFTKEVKKYVNFENVILQQASATISCNCGIGGMGIIFMQKGS